MYTLFTKKIIVGAVVLMKLEVVGITFKLWQALTEPNVLKTFQDVA